MLGTRRGCGASGAWAVTRRAGARPISASTGRAGAGGHRADGCQWYADVSCAPPPAERYAASARFWSFSNLCGMAMDSAQCSPRRWPAGWSDALDRFQLSGTDRVHELLVVLLVLIGVPLGEVGDRFVERVAVAQVRGDGDRVTRPGVGPRQRPPAGA